MPLVKVVAPCFYGGLFRKPGDPDFHYDGPLPSGALEVVVGETPVEFEVNEPPVESVEPKAKKTSKK